MRERIKCIKGFNYQGWLYTLIFNEGEEHEIKYDEDNNPYIVKVIRKFRLKPDSESFKEHFEVLH